MSGAFVAAAAAMTLAIGPCVLVMVRDGLMSALVAYEVATVIAVMVLVCLAQGFARPGEFELPVLLAALSYGSGLVFVHTLERWL